MVSVIFFRCGLEAHLTIGIRVCSIEGEKGGVTIKIFTWAPTSWQILTHIHWCPRKPPVGQFPMISACSFLEHELQIWYRISVAPWLTSSLLILGHIASILEFGNLPILSRCFGSVSLKTTIPHPHSIHPRYRRRCCRWCRCWRGRWLWGGVARADRILRDS